MAATARSAVLFSVRAVQRVLGVILMVVIASFLALLLLQLPHSAKLDDLDLVLRLRRAGDPAVADAGSWFNLAWPSSSFSYLPLGLAFATWIVKIIVDAVFLRGHRTLGKLMPAPQAAGAGDLALGIHDPAGLEGMAADSAQAREQLLKRYREIEGALKTAKRKRCAFLSVDVVGSTQMKIGQRETEVAATFQAYEEMLRKIFEQYGAWKQAWTPDGVMICFLNLDLAVAAAQRILQSLTHFNESDNKLRTPFKVRCGLNEGEVPIYEDSRLEKIAERVIDVAGHMQKQGAVNALWLGEEVYNLLSDKSGFRPTGSEVDGLKAFEWALDAAQASPATASAAS